jgi:hypothetical protein
MGLGRGGSGSRQRRGVRRAGQSCGALPLANFTAQCLTGRRIQRKFAR